MTSCRILASLLLASLTMPVQAYLRDMPSAPVRPLFDDLAPLTQYSDFGAAGVLQAPSARLPREGEFAFSLQNNDPYRLLSVNLGLFPWLEVGARYVVIPEIRTGFGGSFVDKGFDAKLRLLKESDWLPQVSVGLRDMAGTGLFSGEYLVASKRFGDVDFTAGLGWGYLGRGQDVGTPLCGVAARFCTRPTGFTGPGGQFEVDKFFAGPMGAFGGVTWQTPHRPLRVLAELDPNHYRQDFVPIRQTSPINLGLQYLALDSVDLRLAWERGNTLVFGLTYRTDFNRIRHQKYQPPALVSPDQPATELPAWPLLAERLRQQAGFDLEAVRQQGRVLTLQGRQSRQRDQAAWVDRAFRVLQADVPPEAADTLRVEEVYHDQPVVAFEATRDSLDDALAATDRRQPAAAVVRKRDPVPATFQVPLKSTPLPVSPWVTEFQPYLTQALGGTDNFLFYDLGALVRLGWEQGANRLVTVTSVSVVNNYDEFRSPSVPGALPLVRSNNREYFKNRPLRLDAAYYARLFSLPHPGWYGQAYAGYLELMYAGAGGELLYRPLDATWAIGLDVNEARQRQPDSELGLRNYRATTGHLTYYQRLPSLWDTALKVSAGQYLAGDRGVTVTFSKRFASGVTAGAFAAKTNVTAAEVGEGSFHKGIFLTIPLDFTSRQASRYDSTVQWIPIQRDAGAMLLRPQTLWQITEGRERQP